MEENLVRHSFAVSVQYHIHELLHLLRTVNVQVGSTSQQTHCADEPWQAEYVVAVVVADKDVPKTVHVESLAGKTCLSTFAAIYHEQFPTRAYNLARGCVALSRFG